MKKKSVIEDLSRGVYDLRNEMTYSYKSKSGLTEEIVREISEKKEEPLWMTEFRLNSLKIYDSKPIPTWGAELSGLDIENIVTYVKPPTDQMRSWEDVPDYIKKTFDSLGIPKAERESLAGVGAQYDSEVVYHNMKEELSELGVIYTDIETAVKQHEDLVKKYFMKLVPPNDHKFAALHGAVWSGGSFVYVPEGVHVEFPLQSYFRLNAPGAGQFEHTLIIVEKGARLHFIEGCSAPKYSVAGLHAGCVELFVHEDAHLRYSTIENWSKNMYNLNTKRSVVHARGSIEWVSGSFGSKVSMLYPMSILKGEGARADFTGISFAAKGQYLDTGSKMVHAAPNTTSKVLSKSISKDGGTAFYRGLLRILPNAKNAKSSVNCESLMLDDISASDTLPTIEIMNEDVDVGHEAKIGRISDDVIFYLRSRGISEDDAKAMIVHGFVEPITKELPLEYAVELNKLIQLEFEGSIG
jgi:Fe-S cluster assembly protein SufB